MILPTEERASVGRRPRLIAHAFAVLVGVGLAAVALELGLRLADRRGWIWDWENRRTAESSSIWMRSANPQVIFQHRPNYVKDGVRYTERHGILRPTDVAAVPAPGTFRIAAVGDSIGAAIKLPYEQRVFTLVERSLTGRSDDGNVEVLNFCVNGYSTEQEAALVDELVGRFELRALILQFAANDFYPTEFPTRWFLDESPSYLISFVAHQLDRRLLRGYPPADYWERLYRTDQAGWQSVARGFGHIASFASSRGIPALLVVFPAISHGGWLEADARGRQAKVVALGRKAGFEVLDLLPVYATHPVEALRFEPWDTLHPNPLGHRIAAQAIIERLDRMGIPALARR